MFAFAATFASHSMRVEDQWKLLVRVSRFEVCVRKRAILNLILPNNEHRIHITSGFCTIRTGKGKITLRL